MGKRRSKYNRPSEGQSMKRAKTHESDQMISDNLHDYVESDTQMVNFQIEQNDRIEKKIDIIVKDAENNCYRSLSIWGKGLGVEKTIAVVEELKRNYLKQGTRYTQETSIKNGENNEPHLQVVLTLLNAES